MIECFLMLEVCFEEIVVDVVVVFVVYVDERVDGWEYMKTRYVMMSC